MYGKLTTGERKIGKSLMAAALMLGAALAMAGDAVADKELTEWLGMEFTVESSTLNDHIPTGGKMTFVFDSEDNVVRICTRTSSVQREPWNMDFATPCGVAMVFTRGTRYCTFDDVKTGNAEVLSSCHRLRSRDIAMRPAKVKGTLELSDLVAFLIDEGGGKHAMSILVDSPARVTGDGIIIIRP